jgi:hypothetical protein
MTDKKDHDQNHKVLGEHMDCEWCKWELDDMEERTRGAA